MSGEHTGENRLLNTLWKIGAGLSSPLLKTAKGFILAVESGICAGKSVANALILDDISESGFKYPQTLIDSSNIYRELYPIRNSRAVMRDGILIGGLKVALQLFINENIVKVPERLSRI